MTPRKFCDSARSGWRASIASRSFNASEKLLASNSRKALSYIASSSDLEGATLFAAKELNTKTAITAIFRIFIPVCIQPLLATDDKPKILQKFQPTSHAHNKHKPHLGIGLILPRSLLLTSTGLEPTRSLQIRLISSYVQDVKICYDAQT